MKMRWLSLLLAAFLLVAPTVLADDGSSGGWLGDLIDQIVSLVLGEDDLGSNSPPSGQALNGDEAELGMSLPPSG